jgi:hypothetical protein
MLVYVAAVCMNDQDVFQQVTSRNNLFSVKPEWH